MYNIAKVAKGEILIYFNDVFDALSKLAADTELSVKNGAELLDRLVKDIVSESAATYASILLPDTLAGQNHAEDGSPNRSTEITTAFSLPKFIPLLQERINVQNPFARTFLVSWITLLDQIPDLELVAYLPSFLGGLLRFLSDSNEDVHTTTQVALQRFLIEIRKIAMVKKGIAESRRSREEPGRDDNSEIHGDDEDEDAKQELSDETKDEAEKADDVEDEAAAPGEGSNVDNTSEYNSDTAAEDEDSDGFDDEWIPGQDINIEYEKILEILVDFLSSSREVKVQVVALRWIEAFLEICPEDILSFTPRLLEQLLPALSHHEENVSTAATSVNQQLLSYVMSLPEDPARGNGGSTDNSLAMLNLNPNQVQSNIPSLRPGRESYGNDKRESIGASRPRKAFGKDAEAARASQNATPEPTIEDKITLENMVNDLDYEAAVGALTLQFLHEHEATRVAALAWLIQLHRKSPRKILAIQDATFPALLKTLSDPSEAVVTRDLVLLSQISKSSDNSYFTSFMVNLLKLFCTDRRLLETRGNLIIRQLCLSLSAERIYRTLADCLEKDNEDDIEFASIMVQNLNNNLITAPELADLRKRLRNLDSKDGQTFFTVIFRAWCVNAVATFSLCLLAQAYEQAYNLLQIFCEMEMSVAMLIQIDKLVQLLESPVFTYLRMQLLEPERFPYLYKCLYGLLMLLPQSSAFAALKNRLNSVSAIGYLHVGAVAAASSSSSFASTRTAPPGSTGPSVANFADRQNRLKSRDDAASAVRWSDLLEKFRTTQDRVRRSQQRLLRAQHGLDDHNPTLLLSGVAEDNYASTSIDQLRAGGRLRDPRGATAVGHSRNHSAASNRASGNAQNRLSLQVPGSGSQMVSVGTSPGGAGGAAGAPVQPAHLLGRDKGKGGASAGSGGAGFGGPLSRLTGGGAAAGSATSSGLGAFGKGKR
jgi:vacuole morphology and inheritance protein 14